MDPINIISIIGLLIVISFAYGAWRAAPWVPTWKRDLDRFISLADLKPGQKMYDLGCGDGRLVQVAAERGAQAVGLEVALIPYLVAKWRARQVPDGRARIRLSDFWLTDVSDADLVYFFLTPKANPKMKAKLERELRPGARVIAYVWPIEGWQPTAVDRAEGQPALYLYEM